MRIYNPYQLIGYLLLLVLIMTSCEFEDTLEGSGIVTEQRQSVEQFSSIKIDGVLDVYLSQGDSYKVEVRTDDNLHEIVSVESYDNELKIYTNTQNDFEATVMNVYVTAPEINNITLDGVTALYVKDKLTQNSLFVDKRNTGYMYLNAIMQKFTLVSDGVGDVDLVGKAQDAIIDNVMTGDIHAYNFTANNMILTHSGTGTVEIKVLSNLTVELLGVGDVYCEGKPEQISKSGDGVGRLYIND